MHKLAYRHRIRASSSVLINPESETEFFVEFVSSFASFPYPVFSH